MGTFHLYISWSWSGSSQNEWGRRLRAVAHNFSGNTFFFFFCRKRKKRKMGISKAVFHWTSLKGVKAEDAEFPCSVKRRVNNRRNKGSSPGKIYNHEYIRQEVGIKVCKGHEARWDSSSEMHFAVKWLVSDQKAEYTQHKLDEWNAVCVCLDVYTKEFITEYMQSVFHFIKEWSSRNYSETGMA